MKKFMFLLAALLITVLLVSCGTDEGKESVGSTNETVAETNGDVAEEDDEPKLTINPDDYFKVITFELTKEDFRQVAVDYMKKQASIEWVCAVDFSVSEQWENWGIDLTFKKGQKYTGIPYADTKVSYFQFEESLVDGTYTCESSAWKDVYGVQCVSSIMNAVQQFDPSVCGYSDDLMPGNKRFKGVICGDYKVPEGITKTASIIEANTTEEMYAAYAQLQKGDIIITKDIERDVSHLRVVSEEPVIEKNGAGKINPNRSYIKCVEQTNSFDKTRTDIRTTWWIDHMYTFGDLLKTNYVPVTLEIYTKDRSECEVPYILLDREITSQQIENGVLSSTVKSNFPIRFVFFDVYNKSGEFVKREKVYDMAENYAVNLRKYFASVTDELENGEYTLVLSAGIAMDQTELQRVDFTISK